MEEYFDKLATLGKDLEEDFRIAFILSSLPDCYNILTTALEARDEKDLTLSIVKNKLMEEYQKIHKSDENGVEDVKALKAQFESYKKSDVNKPGHSKKKCYSINRLQSRLNLRKVAMMTKKKQRKHQHLLQSLSRQLKS
jgi:hypothetical protein